MVTSKVVVEYIKVEFWPGPIKEERSTSSREFFKPCMILP